MHKKSYAVLGILAIILFFIIGVRFGQRVEKTNKAILYRSSITPTRALSPTVPLLFENYTHASCGAQFLYPNTVRKISESSTSAQFQENSALAIKLDCTKPIDLLQELNNSRASTEEIQIAGKTIKDYHIKDKSTDAYYFQLLNSRNGKTISFMVLKSLLPLFQKSLELIP